MTINFNVVAGGNPGDPSCPKCPFIPSTGRITTRPLPRRIAKISSRSRVATLAVIEGLLSIVPQRLAAGNILELGGSFDTFRSWIVGGKMR